MPVFNFPDRLGPGTGTLQLGVSDSNPGLELIRDIQNLAISKSWDAGKDHWLGVYTELVVQHDSKILLTEQVINEIETHQPAIAALLPTVVLCILDRKEAKQYVEKYEALLKTQTHARPITTVIYPKHAELLDQLREIK